MKNPLVRPFNPRLNRFEAAETDRLTASWQAHGENINAELQRALPALRARSRIAWQNNDYLKKWLQLCKTNIVGPNGPALQVKARNTRRKPDRAGNNQVENDFWNWGRACDVSGRLTWNAAMDLFVTQWKRDGEVLVRLVRNYVNPYKFAVEFIDPERLDVQFSDASKNIRMGVECDDWGKPIAYYILGRDPNDWGTGVKNPRKYRVRVDAAEIIHAFTADFAEQLRGIPHTHTALHRLRRVSEMEISELVAAQEAANKMGFFERAENDEPPVGEDAEYSADDGAFIESSEPGTWHVLPRGATVKTFDPQHPNPNLSGFLKDMLRGAASGLGVNYNSLASNLEGVTFSSLRHGLLEDQDQWKKDQQFLFDNFCRPVFLAWLEMQRGKYRDWERFQEHVWVGRRWAWVRPLEEVKAEQGQLDMRTKTPQQVMRERGFDPEDVLAEWAQWYEMLQDAGISVDGVATPPENNDMSEAQLMETDP